MSQKLPIVSDLSKMFPDIQGELCSRHSILFGKLKNTFSKTYDGMQPQHYLMVKGVLSLYQDQEVRLTAALENGVILMLSPLDSQQPFYINSNHFDEQLIMGRSGGLEEGLNPMADQMQTAIKTAIQGLAGDKLKGGILYLHCNIPQESFSYKQIMLISVMLGVALINDNLANQSIDQLVRAMAGEEIFGSQTFLRQLFKYQNRQFSLKVGQQEYNIPFQKENKMMLIHLDLAKQDVKFERQRRQQLAQRKKQIMNVCEEQAGVNTLLGIFENQEELAGKLSFDKEGRFQDQIMQGGRFLQTSMREFGLMNEFNSGNITFQQYVSAQWQLNAKHWKLHSQQVMDLIEQIKQGLQLNSCMVVNQSFALIVTDRRRYAQLLVFLLQKIHKGELKSKSLFKIEEELSQQRWSSDKNIGEKMFTSSPSNGVAVFDPKEAIWFD